jgi:hypothetical protein
MWRNTQAPALRGNNKSEQKACRDEFVTFVVAARKIRL